MDTHVAQFVRVVLVEEQVRASQQPDEQETDQGRYDMHLGLLSRIYNANLAKRMLPLMILQRTDFTIRQGGEETQARADLFPHFSGLQICNVAAARKSCVKIVLIPFRLTKSTIAIK
jgi:hypothetical protein